MRRFPVHIKNIDGTQTACTTFQLWSGLTTNIAEAHICPPYSAITRTDLTNPTGFTADIYYNEPSLIDEIYVFLVHCDGFILPSSGVPCCGDTQPKKQGGYQIRAVKLFCPTPTPTPTPTRAVVCTFEGGVVTVVSGTLPGPTPTSTPPTPTQTSSGPAPTPTHTPPAPTPTHTSTQLDGNCYSLSYSTIPNDLYVRYRSRVDDTVKTELISSLVTMNNGDNTYTVAICVSQITPYNVPVFVQNGVEVQGGDYTWTQGGACTTDSPCFVGPNAGGPIDFTLTPSCVGYAPTGVTITVSNPTGGSGTGYYVVMTSPEGQDTTHYSLPHSYTGLDNYVGNTYAFSVYDGDGTGGNKVLVDGYSCASAPNNTAYVGLVVSSTKPTSSQCLSAVNYSVELNSPSATFCDATTFTNSNFQGLTTGNNYWLCYDGQTRQMFHPSNAGYFQQAGGCQTV